MKNELQQLLFNTFPIIFPEEIRVNRKYPISYGLEIPDAWLGIVYHLCDEIMTYCTEQNLTIPCVLQAKEKFGYLRIYFNSHSDNRIASFIAEAESDSIKICKKCGSEENIICTTGWVSYICKDCSEKS